MSESSRIAFLLGSGVSIPAGMPCTAAITRRVLSGRGVNRHPTNQIYYVGREFYDSPNGYVRRVRAFLKRLKVEIDGYYLPYYHKTNYEDLYYVAAQVADCELKEYDNPAVQPLIDKILPAVRQLLCRRVVNGRIWEELKLLDLAREACKYIKHVAFHLLSDKPRRLDHLECIIGACKDDALTLVDLFTLNHDLILEQCLLAKQIEFSDGFDRSTNDDGVWAPFRYQKGNARIRIFKLHGSLNWTRRSDGTVTIRRNERPQLRADGEPEFLAGTFNKILEYAAEIYATLQSEFLNSLSRCDHLVIAGYGFCDKAINRRVVEWLMSSPGNRVVAVEKCPDKVRYSARPAIGNHWEEWCKARRIIPIGAKKGICETSWDEIKKAFS